MLAVKFSVKIRASERVGLDRHPFRESEFFACGLAVH